LPDAGPLLYDSITRTGPEAVGRVVVAGSHGGAYTGALACKAGCRAVILHDAGIGRDRAGIAGIVELGRLGRAAAAIDHRSAPIGQAADMLARGVISFANPVAAGCGVRPGMACAEAARLLATAVPVAGPCPDAAESRQVLTPDGAARPLVLIDSASLIRPEDAGTVVVTGSHGAVFGSDPANALKHDAVCALFNDAGGSATGRLPVLETRGIAAATVSAASARIGQARSIWQDGIVSAVNGPARALGAEPGMRARLLVARALGIGAA
jgi:hypothetical protein